jgi:hypothetical protein
MHWITNFMWFMLATLFFKAPIDSIHGGQGTLIFIIPALVCCYGMGYCVYRFILEEHALAYENEILSQLENKD